jgi:hypothetical protein
MLARKQSTGGRRVPQGLKPQSSFTGEAARLKSLSKNAIPGSVANENRPSGAEARADMDELSGTTKVVPFQNGVLERLFQQTVKQCPFKAGGDQIYPSCRFEGFSSSGSAEC